MAAAYYAKVIVGVRVPTYKLFEEKKVKAFAHNHPEDWSVDPKTQKQLWRTEETFLLKGVVCSDFEWKLDGRWEVEKKTKTKAMIAYSDSGDGKRGDFAYIGRLFAQIDVGYDKDNSIKPPNNLLDEQKFLEGLLEPFGLWSEKNFGIWLIGDVSC